MDELVTRRISANVKTSRIDLHKAFGVYTLFLLFSSTFSTIYSSDFYCDVFDMYRRCLAFGNSQNIKVYQNFPKIQWERALFSRFNSFVDNRVSLGVKLHHHKLSYDTLHITILFIDPVYINALIDKHYFLIIY